MGVGSRHPPNSYLGVHNELGLEPYGLLQDLYAIAAKCREMRAGLMLMSRNPAPSALAWQGRICLEGNADGISLVEYCPATWMQMMSALNCELQ